MSGQPKPPSRGAVEMVGELVDDILREAEPWFRDELAENREWVTTKIAVALDEAADGRPLRTGEDGPY